jgi:toxin YoeB
MNGATNFSNYCEMEVYFNELSHRPIGNDEGAGRRRVFELLETMKALRENRFSVLRTHANFYNLQASETYLFGDFFQDTSVSRDQKTLLQSIARNPFIPNEDSPEAEMFVLYKFQATDHGGALVGPEGLAAAYVHGRPILSLPSHSHWQRTPLELMVTDDSGFLYEEEILNFWSKESVEEWAKARPTEKKVEIPLNSKENIKRVFPEPTYHFEDRAMDEMISWISDDERYLRRIVMLIKDISTNPFTGGIGKTETMGGQGGMASKRIGDKDRLTYTYTKEKITIHSCRGHYDDH